MLLTRMCCAQFPTSHCRYHYNVANTRVEQHVEKGNDDGLYISSVACCQDLWALIMDAGTGFAQQVAAARASEAVRLRAVTGGGGEARGEKTQDLLNEKVAFAEELNKLGAEVEEKLAGLQAAVLAQHLFCRYGARARVSAALKASAGGARKC